MKSTLTIKTYQPPQPLQPQTLEHSEQPERDHICSENQSPTVSGDVDQFLNLVFMDFTWNRY